MPGTDLCSRKTSTLAPIRNRVTGGMATMLGRGPAPPRSDADRGLDSLPRQRQLAQAHAGRVGDRVGDGRRGRSLRRLAGAEKRRAGAFDHVDFDAVGHLGEARDRVGCPIVAYDPASVERDGLVERPAHRLDDATFDLVAYPVGIDHLSAVDRADWTDHARAPGFALDFDLHREREVRREVLVAREREAASSTAGLGVTRPAESRGG